jgi:hypothetical protein
MLGFHGNGPLIPDKPTAAPIRNPSSGSVLYDRFRGKPGMTAHFHRKSAGF